MSIHSPDNITQERLRIGMMMVFNLILRNKINYDYIQSCFRNYPDLIREYGDDPWHSSEVISSLHYELLLRRAYPILIRGFADDVLITGDNPVVVFRHPYRIGTVYLLPIDRRHIFCLGYYLREEELLFLETYINKAEIIPENINKWIRVQAETFYIILEITLSFLFFL